MTAIRKPKDAGDIDLLELLKWTLNSANSFFSGLHKEGIWLNQNCARSILEHAFNSSES